MANETSVVLTADSSGYVAALDKAVKSNDALRRSVASSADVMQAKYQALTDLGEKATEAQRRQAIAQVNNMAMMAATAGKSAAEMALMRAEAAGAGGAVQGFFKQIEAGAGGAHAGLAGVSRELMVMAHEGLTGNFKRMGGSAMVLGERLNILEGLLSPLGASLIVGSAAAAAFAYTMYEGYEQAEAFNKAIQSTSGYLGLSVGQMGEMSNGLVSTSASLSTVREAMAQVAATGAFTGDQLQLATRAALAMASDIGIGTDKAAESLAKIQDNVIGWVTAYQREHHEFTAAQIEEIENFVKLGDTADATKVILSGIATSHAAIEADANAHMGAVLTWWTQFKDTVGQVKASILSIGMPDSIDKQVGDQYARVESAQANLKQQQAMGAMGNLASAQQALDIETKKLQVLRDQQGTEHKTQQAREQAAKGGDAKVAVDSYLDADKYATPERRHTLDLQAESADFAKATAGLVKGSADYEAALKRHYENVAQINEQYAKKTRPKEGGINAGITTLKGDNQQTEAELKRHMAMLKDMYADGELTQAAYLKKTHDAQLAALEQEVALDKQIAAAAATKRNPDALASANNTLREAQAKLSALQSGLDTSAPVSDMYSEAARQQAQQAALAKTQRGYDTANAEQFMPEQQRQQYAQMASLHEQYLDQIQALDQKYNTTPEQQSQEYQNALQALQTQYDQQYQMLTQQMDKEQQVRDSYSDQMDAAFVKLSGDGQTNAQAVGEAFTSVWQDSANALDTFLTTGKGNFDQFTAGIIADLAKIALQQAEMQMFSSIAGLFGGAANFSGAFGAGGTPATAVGAGAWGLGSAVPAYATGGHITGPGNGTSDSIPAMLSNGEFVVNAAATSKNRGLLETINSGGMAHFASGGAVGSVAPSQGSSGSGSPVSVTVHNNGSQGGGLTDKDAKDLHAIVQAFVDKRMAQNMRGQGGYAYQMKYNQM